MSYEPLKRTMDVVLSASGLIILSPILLFAALVVKLTSEGAVFVEISNRVGKKGQVFRMYKFRTMIKDSHLLIRKDPRFRRLFEEYRKNSFKLKKDPRVTPFGAFLRKTSIDELPQLLNVLKGEMSLVGPRAFYKDELNAQKKKFPLCQKLVQEALKVKPGITGIWQVSGRSKIGFEKRIEMDATYAQKKSLLLDLYILAKTPLAIIKGEGVS